MALELTIRREKEDYSVNFPYHPQLVEAVKKIPNRRWFAAKKQWIVPKSSGEYFKRWLDEVRAFASVSLDDGIEAELIACAQVNRANVEASRAAVSDIDIPCPAGLDYLPFQRAGIAYASGRPNTLFGDDMGLGKTIQAIGVSNTDPEARSILVVCPSSLRLNWQREWRKWCVKKLTVGVAYAGGAMFPTTNVVVINYDILKRHIEQIHARSWDMLICDEAHALKNYKSQRTMYVLGGREKIKAKVGGRMVHADTVDHPAIQAKRKLFLSGTPILNRPIEAWTLVHALAPNVFRSWKHYVYRYCGASADGYGTDVSGATNLPELQDLLRANIMVRRLKVDVLKELPAKRRQVIELPSDSAAVTVERAAFNEMQKRLMELRVNAELAKGGTDEEYRAAVEMLQQGASGAFTELAKLRHATAIAKLPMVIEHCKEAIESGKIVIFAHHKDVVTAIREAFPDAVCVVGDTALHDRQAAVDRFQTVDTCRVIVGSFGAMSVGLTLTASSHVIFAELDWVPAIMSQAEDRCNRIGQVNSVLAQHLVLEGSLDAVMAHRLVAKQKVIDAALDTETTMDQEPLLPLMVEDAATQGTTRAKIVEEAASISMEETGVIHEKLRALALMCDGANSVDGAGFNKLDTAIGKSLAGCARLSPRQAALGRKLVIKYRRQLTGVFT